MCDIFRCPPAVVTVFRQNRSQNAKIRNSHFAHLLKRRTAYGTSIKEYSGFENLRVGRHRTGSTGRVWQVRIIIEFRIILRQYLKHLP